MGVCIYQPPFFSFNFIILSYQLHQLAELTTLSGGSFAINSYDESIEFCINLARIHYENFPVVSKILPREKQIALAVIYAFARIGDDISDELTGYDKDVRIKLLDNFLENSLTCIDSNNPVFTALKFIKKQHELPDEPFVKLIAAFKMDSDFRQPDSFDDLMYYCSLSANPVGELVLRLYNYYNENTAPLSDSICTALQLTNFWQDLSVDLNKGRMYIPNNYLQKHEITNEDLPRRTNTNSVKDCILELIQETNSLYKNGEKLPTMLKDFLLKLQIKATINGGKSILNLCQESIDTLLVTRPKLKSRNVFLLLIKSLF